MGDEGGVVAVTLAFAHHQGRCQGHDAGVDVYHRAAGEIQGPQVLEPAAVTPDPVSHRTIDDGDPQDHEHQKSAEFHPFGKGAGDQSRRDDGEHGLVNHEGLVRDGFGIRLERLGPHPHEAQVIQVADEVAHIGAKGQAIPVKGPENPDHSQQDKVLHEGCQDIFGPHHAAIEQG